MEKKYSSAFASHLLKLGSKRIPMHMPGHKRNTELLGDALPYEIDFTEVDGSDDLHSMEDGGIISTLALSLSSLYGADCAYPLVGGSSCGILAAIRTLCRPYDRIIVARNSHKSVYHAIELCRLRAEYILPDISLESGICDPITPRDVEEAFLRAPDAVCVIITSPTYEGVVSDIDSIAEVCHRHGASLFVDAAHGAHFGMHPSLPPFPTSADIAVTSLHKTLPSLTSCAVALVYNPKHARTMGRNLSVFETSSPSYVLLSSIASMLELLERDGAALFDEYAKNLELLYSRLSSLTSLSLIRTLDIGKLVISTKNTKISGKELSRILRDEYAIECEMAHLNYVLLMTSIADKKEALVAVSDALLSIDSTLERTESAQSPTFISTLPPKQMELYDAVFDTTEDEDDDRECRVGTVSHSYIWAYPPGVPLVVPGEKLTDEIISLMDRLKKSGISLKKVKTP